MGPHYISDNKVMYVRRGSGEKISVFGPKPKDHPSIGTACPRCNVEFIEGDDTALIAIEPANAEEMKKMREKQPYNSLAEEIHARCLAPDDGPTFKVEEPGD